MRIVTMADVQNYLEEFADEVVNQGERVLVARDGGEHLMIISTRELAAIEAALEALADLETRRSGTDPAPAAGRRYPPESEDER